MTDVRRTPETAWPTGLYGMADAGFGDPYEHFRILAEEGVGTVQLRCKGWSTEALTELAVWAAARGGPRVVVNDDVAAARAAGCAVHLGQEDGHTDLVHGRSTHTLDQVAQAGGAAYLGFGPVHGTTTKDTGYAPRGLELLRAVVRLSPRPVVAIGGIGPENLDAVRATGVAAWAVVGAIWRAPDPRAAIRACR